MRSLTIIIATYNRCDLLPKVLKSLLDQKVNGPFNYDILLVDNASDDETRQVAETFIPLFKDKLRYIFEPKKGKAFAVNRAITESQGEILAFTDDDVVVDDLWLSNIVECFQKYGCDGMGGRILPEYPANTPEWIKNNADILAGPIVSYDHGQDTKPYAKPMYEFLGANFAFKRALFEQYGYFRTEIGPGAGTLGEDTEIVNRFLKAGKKLYYCGKAVVWHPVEDHRMNLKYIWKWNVGLGRYRFIADEQRKIDLSLVYWSGIPRYLILIMLRDTARIAMNIFNKRGLLLAWIDLSRNWGKATEIRKVYLNKNA